jgi:6-pyruvoyltetrahydropterin/6-carboxytetrahydropterin synthase
MKAKMKLRTEFDFDAAHRLVGYDGKCHRLHGHMWRVIIEVMDGEAELDSIGMLWDFTNGKALKDLFDHKTILKKCPENQEIMDVLIKVCGSESVVVLEENPTAEYLALYIKQILEEKSDNLKFKVKVYESPKSYVEVQDEFRIL